MPKKSAASSAELAALLTNLLRQLRARISKSPPLFVVEIKNNFSRHPDFLQLLMTGIAGPNRAYVRLGSGPEIGDIIAYGDDLPSIDKSIAALREVTPAIFNLIDHLRKTATPIQMTPDQQLTMVGPLICTLVEITRINHPESQSLPKIVAGPIVCRAACLEFPNGAKLPSSTMQSDLWQQIQAGLSQNAPTIRMLEVPALKAAASVASQMLKSITPRKTVTRPKPVRTKRGRSPKAKREIP